MFDVKQMEFADRDAAKRWIILNQFGRRNLSAYDRSILALKLKPMIAEKAKEQQIRKSVSQKSVEQKPIDTQKELAKVAGVSHDTIHKQGYLLIQCRYDTILADDNNTWRGEAWHG